MERSLGKQAGRLSPVAALMVLLVSIAMLNVAQALYVPAAEPTGVSSMQINNGSSASGSVVAKAVGFVRIGESDPEPLDIHTGTIHAVGHHGQRLIVLMGPLVGFRLKYSIHRREPGNEHMDSFLTAKVWDNVDKRLEDLVLLNLEFDFKQIDDSHYSISIYHPWDMTRSDNKGKLISEMSFKSLQLDIEDSVHI